MVMPRPSEHVADDLVARDRAAAAREAQRDVFDALDADAVLRRRPSGGRNGRRLRLHEVLDRSTAPRRPLALLESLEDLVDDRLGRDLAAPRAM
jgi:hypothetical protein